MSDNSLVHVLHHLFIGTFPLPFTFIADKPEKEESGVFVPTNVPFICRHMAFTPIVYHTTFAQIYFFLQCYIAITMSFSCYCFFWLYKSNIPYGTIREKKNRDEVFWKL